LAEKKDRLMDGREKLQHVPLGQEKKTRRAGAIIPEKRGGDLILLNDRKVEGSSFSAFLKGRRGDPSSWRGNREKGRREES